MGNEVDLKADGLTHEGACLCGGVRYQTLSQLRDVVACHCSQCRRTSGHFVAMTQIPLVDFKWVCSSTLVWYRSSDKAERGFCSVCGGNLFWRQIGGSDMSIAAGTLDNPTHLKMQEHIYTADKSDYYQLDDELPKS